MNEIEQLQQTESKLDKTERERDKYEKGKSLLGSRPKSTDCVHDNGGMSL